jgi:hypothetical protein
MPVSTRDRGSILPAVPPPGDVKLARYGYGFLAYGLLAFWYIAGFE